jgi:hypothetical protein
MKKLILAGLVCLAALGAAAEDNVLSPEEQAEGWVLLFDGKTMKGWQTSDQKDSQKPPEDGSINPHGTGHYMLIHERQWQDFVLKLDFKLSPGCNSGVFLRTFPLTPLPGWDVGYNGIEVALDDTKTAGYTDTGAVYDLSKPLKNAMKPVGEWNSVEITNKDNWIHVVINGEPVNSVDLNAFTKASTRPDGTPHKFEKTFNDHPRQGYLGLQDHGSNCWFKNIKLLPIETKAVAR